MLHSSYGVRLELDARRPAGLLEGMWAHGGSPDASPAVMAILLLFVTRRQADRAVPNKA